MNSSKGRFDPFDFNWEDIQKKFMQSQKNTFNNDMSWLDDYIEDAVAQAFPAGHKKSMHRTRLKPDVFETHHYVIVRVTIPEQVNSRKLRVFFSANELRIAGIKDSEETVPLPALCHYEGCKALLKEDVLEIRVAKQLNEPYREIDIQHL